MNFFKPVEKKELNEYLVTLLHKNEKIQYKFPEYTWSSLYDKITKANFKVVSIRVNNE